MPRYFFDIYNGGSSRDDVGVELPDIAAVRATAMDALPKVAAEEIAADGDRRSFIVVARDETGRTVYTATLSFVGLTLPGPDPVTTSTSTGT